MIERAAIVPLLRCNCKMVYIMDMINRIFGTSGRLWQYIKQYAIKMGRSATRPVLELYFVLKAPTTPIGDKVIIVTALAYQLLPSDLLSKKKFGIIGLLDNAVTLAIAYNRVKKRITPEIKLEVENVLNNWFGVEYKIIEK